LKREILIPRETIRKRVRELGEQISADYADKDTVLIGILNGVIFFFVDLIRHISIPTKIDFVRAASYGSKMYSNGDIRLTKDVEISIEGKSVIVVDDIMDTGVTLANIISRLERRRPESIRICVLIDKSERREVYVPVHYHGFRIEEGFLVGYGLDYNEEYRNMPDICVLR
jgi:hypoxanthine phosphoribosyltransferase